MVRFENCYELNTYLGLTPYPIPVLGLYILYWVGISSLIRIHSYSGMNTYLGLTLYPIPVLGQYILTGTYS